MCFRAGSAEARRPGEAIFMNILFCSKKTAFGGRPVGGAETSMRLMAETLVKGGGKPVYLIFGVDKAVPAMAPKDVNGITLYHYCTARYLFLEAIADRIRLPGCVLRLEQFVNKIVLRRVLKFISRKHAVDIVYTSYDKDILVPLLAFKQKHKCAFKVVMRMAGLYWYERIVDGTTPASEYEFIFNHVDAINYLSPSFKALAESRMRELGMRVRPRNEFICDIGSGLEPRCAAGAEASGREKFTIVTVMRFSNYQKRQDILLRAIAMLKDSLAVEALFIGSGIRRTEMIALAKSLGIEDRVRFVEYMPQQALWQEMAGADLLCHPCEYEGVSKILLEGMAMGLPVLASNVSPLQDYVFDGQTGFLADNTPEAWARTISFLCNDRELLGRVSGSAVRYIREHQLPGENIKKYLGHFRALTGTGA